MLKIYKQICTWPKGQVHFVICGGAVNKKRAIFIDVDGTLISMSGDQKFSSIVKDAVQTVRSSGN